MDQAAREREIEDEANALFGGAVRRVTLLPVSDLAGRGTEYRRFLERNEFGPDEVLPQVVLAEPPDRGAARPPEALRMYRHGGGPAIREFRRVLAERFPEVRHLEVRLEDAEGKDSGRVMLVIEGDGRAAEGADTTVSVRLKEPELATLDTLVAAGLAANRAEALRWAVARVRERPAFTELQEHTREIQRLRGEL
jgi:hypothetical protein